jgi:pullulanase/glycogen debranching enzyme
MIHEGQEFARSKVIPLDTGVPDPNKGHIDHNSYEKDNETNYLNFTHARLNTGLVDYYKGLIKLRTTYAAFRRAEYDEVKFFPQSANHFALGYTITHNGEQFVCLFNAHPTKAQDFTLPEGNYDILVNESNAGIKSLGKAAGVVTLSPSTARIFKRKID